MQAPEGWMKGAANENDSSRIPSHTCGSVGSPSCRERAGVSQFRRKIRKWMRVKSILCHGVCMRPHGGRGEGGGGGRRKRRGFSRWHPEEVSLSHGHHKSFVFAQSAKKTKESSIMDHVVDGNLLIWRDVCVSVCVSE